jgi:segregation and condensation protein B
VPDDALISALESILLVAAEPVSIAALASATGQPKSAVTAALGELEVSLTRGIRLQCQDGMAQLVSAPENTEAVQTFLGVVRPRPLSRAALEVLTVVAYKQPVTRAEIDAARGVSSDRPLQTLIGRELVEEKGHRSGPGNPAEYGTTFAFLEYFGLSSLAELPPLEESQVESVAPDAIGLRGNRNEDPASAEFPA